MGRLSLLSLINTVFLLLLTLSVLFAGVELEPVFSYKVHKLLHLAGVIAFLGNVMVGPLWVVFANRTQDVKVLKFSFSILLLTDVIITLPAIDLTVLNGLFLAEYMGGIHAHYWLKHSLWDLLVLWVLVFPIHYIQEQLFGMIDKGEVKTKRYRQFMIGWMVTGGVSLVPVIHIFYLMIFKVY